MRAAKSLLFLVIFSVVVNACRQKDAPPDLFFDYRVWGDEESGMITVRLQYRTGGLDGQPIPLPPQTVVAFDGFRVHPDSSRRNGPYYEADRPADGFGGIHRIEFTAPGAAAITEEFGFPLFSLATPLAEDLPRQDIVLQFEGLKDGDLVNTLVNDTSFLGRGIDRMDTVRDGRILITRTDLLNLANGPIHLEIYKEDERRLKKGGQQGGRLWLSYGINCEFELREAE
jgi:hypothetical protein